ncbi:MAG: group III truncated hemoglobin [Marinobacter sp.]|uniref:group III truncated hemoglobin n=1 Tax=Marinobacter sp. TaxID=50741 RepID=UPI00299EB4B0|nr:group III truncated hemoglobin [Marinobacter sp.]MDX1634463.1 group III truncated hemoglobin [Marinobacter sp.]
MAPVFTEVAGIRLEEHLPLIEAYWRKMLLGQRGYSRHMIHHHERIHDRSALTQRHFRRWLMHFEATLDENFDGPYTDRARTLARRIMANLETWLAQRDRAGVRPD